MGDNRIATKNDWDNEEMPKKNDTFILERSFSEQEMEALRRGNIPKEMEDKWFWYMEGNILYAHRSWTGICIYIIEFKDDNNHLVRVNRDPEQYSCTSVDEDRIQLDSLLNWWSQSQYDHYREWISETVDAINRSKESS